MVAQDRRDLVISERNAHDTEGCDERKILSKSCFCAAIAPAREQRALAAWHNGPTIKAAEMKAVRASSGALVRGLATSTLRLVDKASALPAPFAICTIRRWVAENDDGDGHSGSSLRCWGGEGEEGEGVWLTGKLTMAKGAAGRDAQSRIGGEKAEEERKQ